MGMMLNPVNIFKRGADEEKSEIARLVSGRVESLSD